MTEHISKQYDQDLEAIRSRMLQMGGLVESQIRSAVAGYLQGDAERIEQVIATDAKVNELEIAIDDDLRHVIVRRQPAASDLRLIMAVSKAVTDLERIGDEAVNIAERAEEAGEGSKLVPHPHLRSMADLTQQMLRDALDAFVDADVVRAERVRLGDDAVDELYGKTLGEMMTFMAQNPERIPAAMGVINVAKYLERIADHATNIAEEVIFMVAGHDVRHESLRADDGRES